MRRKKRKTSYDHGLERTSVPSRQPQQGPAPLMQNPVQPINIRGNQPYNPFSNQMPYGMPSYTSFDEYGRAYAPKMRFAPQPNSAPVPVPIPHTLVQTAPIVAPVDFSQNNPARPEN